MLDRRDFLTRAAGAGLAAALPIDGALASPMSKMSTMSAIAPGADAWDLTWPAKLRGKSRAVFDSPKVGEGGALFRAALWREQLHDVLGVAREDVTPVVVFRHEGIALAMDDGYWERMDVGKKEKLRDPATKKWTKRNPIASASKDAPAPFNEISLPAFIANGGVALACGLAFEQVVDDYKQKDKLDDAAAKQRAHEHLIPGIILQPSGFFAVLRAQEEGCHYFQGS